MYKTKNCIVFTEFWAHEDCVIDQVFEGCTDALIIFMTEELAYKNIRDYDFNKDISKDVLETKKTNTKYLCEKFNLDISNLNSQTEDKIDLSSDIFKKTLEIYNYLIKQICIENNIEIDNDKLFKHEYCSFKNDKLTWEVEEKLLTQYK